MVQSYDDEATALVGFCFPGIPILTLRHRLQTMAGTQRPLETVLFIRFRSHRSYSRFSRTLARMHALIQTFSHHSPLNSLARTYGRTHALHSDFRPRSRRSRLDFLAASHARTSPGSLPVPTFTLLIPFSLHHLFRVHCRFLVFILGIVCSSNQGMQ